MAIETNDQLIQKLSHALAQYEDRVGANWGHWEEIIFTFGSLQTCCAAIACDTKSLLNFLNGPNAPAQVRRSALHRLRQVFPAIAELGKGVEAGIHSVAELEGRAFDLAGTIEDLCGDVGIASKFNKLAVRSSQLLEQAIALWSTAATGSK